MVNLIENNTKNIKINAPKFFFSFLPIIYINDDETRE